MTRRSPSATKPDSSTAPTTSSATPKVDGLEERVLAFAEQLGRIAGAVQAKTAGWMDGDASGIGRFDSRIASATDDVRDSTSAAAVSPWS